MIAQFLRSICRWAQQKFWPSQCQPRSILVIARWDANDEPTPALHWAPCHPATVARFKATVVCDRGHALTLRQHAIDAQGVVSPSVVCPAPGCDFHRFVQLDQWANGFIE